jgi:predicted GNAT family N-acyltransferase
MDLRFITTNDPEYAEELDLRYRVLRAPLGMGRDAVGLGREVDSDHLIAVEGGRVVGCVLHVHDEEGDRIRAMAVDAGRQGEGIGGRLLLRMEEELRARRIASVVLHARVSAVGFYERHGYATYGDPFVEVTIPHVKMRKTL